MRHVFSPIHHPHVSRVVWLALVALLILLVSRRVEAQVEQVYTNGPVAVLTAPDWSSPVVDQWPAGVPVILSGCLQDRSWCQVSWGPEQGWVVSSSLVASVGGNTIIFSNWTWAVPLVIFDGGRPYPRPWYPPHDRDGQPWHDRDDNHHGDHDRDGDRDHDDHGRAPSPHPTPHGPPWQDNNGH